MQIAFKSFQIRRMLRQPLFPMTCCLVVVDFQLKSQPREFGDNLPGNNKAVAKGVGKGSKRLVDHSGPQPLRTRFPR